MRLVYILLLAAIVSVQYPLWWGSQGYAHVAELKEELQDVQALNHVLEARNAAMLADISDLQKGGDAVDELARRSLNLLGNNEVMVQVIDLPPGSNQHTHMLTPVPAQKLKPMVIMPNKKP